MYAYIQYFCLVLKSVKNGARYGIKTRGKRIEEFIIRRKEDRRERLAGKDINYKLKVNKIKGSLQDDFFL